MVQISSQISGWITEKWVGFKRNPEAILLDVDYKYGYKSGTSSMKHRNKEMCYGGSI